MERKDVLQEPAYWITQIQIAIYDCATRFMSETGKNKTELAQHLGVSKGYVSQLLSGDYNFSITKLVETAMLMGMVPQMSFKSLDEILLQDEVPFSCSWTMDHALCGFETYEKDENELLKMVA